MRLPSLLAAASVAAALLLSPLARAGDGHDHGDTGPTPAGPALPRFAAVSESFELVGVLDGRRLVLYLDRADDNAPVTDARIELDIAGAQLKAEKHDDAYEVVLAATPKPGVLPITATVHAGDEVDLLAGEFDLHEAEHADDAAHVHSWKAYSGWAAAAVAALVALTLIGRRVAASRRRAGVAA